MTVPDSIRKVVVTQRIDFIESRREFRDAVDQKLLQWLIQADVLPIPLPNALAVVHPSAGNIGGFTSSDLTDASLLK